MATITRFVDGTYPVVNGVKTNMFAAEVLIDMTKAPSLANDVVQLLKIPAETIVTHVAVIVVTPEGTTCTMDFGDSTNATRYHSNVNMNASANTAVVSTTPVFYPTATTIDARLDHNSSNAKFIVKVMGAILEN